MDAQANIRMEPDAFISGGDHVNIVVILLGGATILAFDTIGPLASLRFRFPYARLMFSSFAIYFVVDAAAVKAHQDIPGKAPEMDIQGSVCGRPIELLPNMRMIRGVRRSSALASQKLGIQT